MFDEAEVPRDLVNLVVPECRGLVAMGERREPFRLVDGDGLVVACCGSFGTFRRRAVLIDDPVLRA